MGFNRRRKVVVDVTRLKKLPPRLQAAVLKALGQAVEEKKFPNSPLLKPPAAVTDPPPGLFLSFAEILKRLPIRSILEIARTRYWRLSQVERETIKSRLSWSTSDVIAWADHGITLSERTDPPAQPETPS